VPALIVRSDGSIERLDPTCTVLGMFEDWECAMAASQMKSGDLLALYTDGVTESFNEAQEQFGEDRLIEALRRHCGLSARELAASVVDEVALFSANEQFDDITLIIAKRLGGGEIACSDVRYDGEENHGGAN
jgi:serine phosphatase RsbU (regulator of sigma subunit)